MVHLSVLPADTFLVSNRTILHDHDRNLLIMLYQPIIGCTAVSLYFSLWSYLDQSGVLSSEWTHHHLMTNLCLNLDLIMESREKLEAIGLVKTYYKKDHVNHYVYELYSPISVSDFFQNPILNTSYYNAVGKTEYQKVLDQFKIPKLNLSDYTDITCLFHEIFSSTPNPNLMMLEDIKKTRSGHMMLISDIDLESVLKGIPEDLLPRHSFTKDTKDLLYKLSFIYNFNETELNELIRNSLNERKMIDKTLLKENSKRYYQFEHSGKLPSLVYRSQPEYLRKAVGDTSKRAKMIYTFETTSPYDFLVSKNGGERPSVGELNQILYLMDELKLTPGVINVLLDYVLKINHNKLVKAFVETIASQWKREKIETVEDAMNLAEAEYGKRTKALRPSYQRKKEETKPDWFDQEIKKEDVSSEEASALDQLLAKYKEK